MAGPFQLGVQLCHSRAAEGRWWQLHGLMDFQHYKSHGLTEVRVGLSGQHSSSCPSPVLGLDGLWGHCCTELLALMTGRASGGMIWVEAWTPGI